MKHLIIDITELAGWQGKLTGVPRVMNELSRRFSSREDVLFVAWDGAGHFRKIDFDELSSKLAPEKTGQSPRQPGPELGKLINAAKRLKNKSRITARLLATPERVARRLFRPSPMAKLQDEVELKKGDIFFALADWHASNSGYVRRVGQIKEEGVKLVQFSYDLLPIIAPQYSGHATEYLEKFTKKTYPLCDLIISDSKNTKVDIKKWLSQNELTVPRIEVVRLGDDFHITESVKPHGESFIGAGLKGGDYILCVGTVEARKNHMLLYYVYKLARQRGIILPKTLIVGRPGWHTEELRELITKDPDIKRDLVFLQNTSDEELSWLYSHCLFTVYPSFYEGWGLPIAESLSRGVPCICSDTSSTPEVGGDLVDYFSPASPDECLAAITKLLEPKALKAARAKAAKYQPTSWDATFRQVQKFIEEL